MKFGTVLFRKGGDLLVSLSWALGASSASRKAQTETFDCTASMGGDRFQLVQLLW